MVELAEIFRTYGAAYCAQWAAEAGRRLPASHRKAMAELEACRTEKLGGHLYACPDCEAIRYRYHSCRNRHCPKCQHDEAKSWLEQQQALLLPVPYFLVTFTLPANLRDIARCNQKTIYNLLFRTSAAALQQMAKDPRFVGGQIGMMGVLQTWTRDLLYHPHIHYLVPGGGLSADGQSWLASRKNFLLPVKPLAVLFRAKFRSALRQTKLGDQVPTATWSQAWVVDCRPVGNGEMALRYLVPYVFRVAISNRRILKAEEGRVTFTYKASETGKTKRCTVAAEEFIRRFLQHVLPNGLVKIRYYGLLSPGNRHRLQQARQRLGLSQKATRIPAQAADAVIEQSGQPQRPIYCPRCGQIMLCVQTIRPRCREPPT